MVVVLVARLDMATARALQYARTLTPDDLRAVHFDIDSKEARELEEEWGRLGLARLPLDIIECPDRRLGRAAIELVADATLDGDTECTVLLPRRSYSRVWQRVLHDRTADKIASVLSQVPHVAATIIPYNLPGRFSERVRTYGRSVQQSRLTSTSDATVGTAAAATRRRGRAHGRRPRRLAPREPAQGERGGRGRPRARPAGRDHHADRQRRHAPAGQGGGAGQVGAGAAAGREFEPRMCPERRHRRPAPGLPGPSRRSPGSSPGARLVAEGMVGTWGRRPAMLNPAFELVAGAEQDAGGN